MTSSRRISCAISGRLNEYELRPSLILTPGLRLTSPDARAAAGVKAKADEASAIERVRNARRRVCPSMETSGVGPVYNKTAGLAAGELALPGAEDGLPADRVNKRSVARHIPYLDARPLPVLRFHIPAEGL